MADFKKFIPLLKELEGGFVDNPLDQGGATNMGVTLNTFRNFYGMEKTVEDLKKMSENQWGHIMKTGYWDKCRADEIINQSLAEIIVDWCINSGQTVIRKVQEVAGVRPDGVFGPLTLQAINNGNPQEMHRRIMLARKQFYINIVRRVPSQKIFMNGWMSRLEHFVYKG